MQLLTRRGPAGLIALLLALATLGLAAPDAIGADQPTAAAAAGLPPVLKVGTEGVYPPFSYHDADGRLTGYDIDVMNAIGKKLGIKIQYVETQWDSMFAALAAKRIDLVANEVTLNPQRQALYDVSKPYVTTTGVVVVKKGNTTIKGLGDLKGQKAGESLTSNWGDMAKADGAQIVGIDQLPLAMSSLAQGRIDVVVNDKLAVRNFLATTGNQDVKVVAETTDTSQSVLAARKGSGYMPQINKAIADLQQDGTLKGIYDQYFTAKPARPTTWGLFKGNAGPMLRSTITGTIPLTAISFTIGLVLALFVALARMSKSRPLSGLARLVISIVRGTPLLVQLFIIYYAFPALNIDFNPFTAAIIAFSLNVGGYGAEIIRSAIESLPRGQWEAASTVGMGYAATLRRVILPQAARTAVPPLSNTLISLVKDTSLASIITVVELLRRAQIAAAPTQEFLPMYGLAAIYYWVVCLVLSFVQSRTETRLNRFVAA